MPNRNTRVTAPSLGACLALLACSLVIASPRVLAQTARTAAVNVLTPAEAAAGWTLLFDGRTLTGWHGLGVVGGAPGNWDVRDGAIHKVLVPKGAAAPDGQPLDGTDLITDQTWGDFELSFDWKITPGGNSGVKYNVSEGLSMLEPPAHAAIGFEYQVLDDDRHPDGKLPTHRAGALYDLVAPNAAKHLSPVGEWNTSRIVFAGGHGEHWLNGAKVVEYDLGRPAMDSAFAKSKYHTMPWFAARRYAHIVLQDHGDEVFYRNVKIRPLTSRRP